MGVSWVTIQPREFHFLRRGRCTAIATRKDKSLGNRWQKQGLLFIRLRERVFQQDGSRLTFSAMAGYLVEHSRSTPIDQWPRTIDLLKGSRLLERRRFPWQYRASYRTSFIVFDDLEVGKTET